MQRAAASEVPPILGGLACGGGVEGHQPPMQLFLEGETSCSGCFASRSSEIKALPASPAGRSGVPEERLCSQCVLVSRGDSGCAVSWDSSGKCLEKQEPLPEHCWCWAICVFSVFPGEC